LAIVNPKLKNQPGMRKRAGRRNRRHASDKPFKLSLRRPLQCAQTNAAKTDQTVTNFPIDPALSAVDDAYRALEGGATAGKIVVDIRE
jgi:hypothetical protein